MCGLPDGCMPLNTRFIKGYYNLAKRENKSPLLIPSERRFYRRSRYMPSSRSFSTNPFAFDVQHFAGGDPLRHLERFLPVERLYFVAAAQECVRKFDRKFCQQVWTLFFKPVVGGDMDFDIQVPGGAT